MITCKQCIHYAYKPLGHGWVKRHVCTLGKEMEVLYNEPICSRFKPRENNDKPNK